MIEPGVPIIAGRESRPWAAGLALAVLLVVATLGQGGDSVFGLVVWHTLLLLFGLLAWVVPMQSGLRLGHVSGGSGAAFAFFVLLVLVGATQADNLYSAWLTCLELLAFALVALLASSVDRGWNGPGLWFLRLAAAGQGVLLIVQRLTQGTARPAGTFLNTNHAAAWLVAVILLSFATSRRGSVVDRRLALALAAPALVAVFLTGSRGALLGLLVGAAWLFAEYASRLRRKQWVAVAVLLLAVTAVVGWRQLDRLSRDAFIFHRAHIWSASLDVAFREPLWGSGPGQFGEASANVQFDDKNGALRYDRGFHTTHSDLLRPAAELGMPTALALTLALGLAIREIRCRRRGENWSNFDEGALAALLAFSAQAMVDNLSSWPAVYLLAAALLGHLLRPLSPNPERGAIKPTRVIRAVVATAVLVIFAATEIRPTLAYLGVADLPRGRLSATELERLNLAISRNSIHPDFRMRLAEHLMDDALTLESVAEAREHAETAVRLSRGDGRLVSRLAGIERVACGRMFRDVECRDRVLVRFAAAAQLRRTDVGILLDAAEFALATGAMARSAQLAESALVIEPNAVPARLILAEALMGNQPPDALRATVLINEGARIAVEHQHERKKSSYAAVMLDFDVARGNRLGRRAVELLSEAGS